MTSLLSALTGDPEIAALLSDEAQVEAMLAFERALAEASATVGFISEKAGRAIASGLADFKVDHDGLRDGMARDGVPVPALIKQLKQQLSPEAASDVHKGATSQDVVDTALMLQLAQVLSKYESRLNGLLKTLDRLELDNGTKTLLAHTRMQVALPTTWSAKLTSWSEPLARSLNAITALRRTGLVLQLGGPVGDRASFGGFGDSIAAHMAKRLDLGLAKPWHNQRDQIIALGSVLVQISGTLGKLGMDIALLSQNEVGVVRLKGGGTSSAMAHKSNPVNAEVLVALAHFVAGLSGTLNMAMIHENERSGMAWTLEWLTLPQMLIATGASLSRAAALLEQLEIQ